MYDPKYKLKHKLPPISRLTRYKYHPPPMVGDPLICARTLADRCEVLYTLAMQIKRGERKPWMPPPPPKIGLWFWRDNGQSNQGA